MKIAAAISERGHDLYETSPEAVEALMRAEELPKCIWEPACGRCSIVRTLRFAGHEVFATDLVSYDTPDQTYAHWDFLTSEYTAPCGIEAIVTNPPFKDAGAFVVKALSVCPRVYMLLRLTFLEGQGRTPILESGKLARVHVFRNRLPMMHRDGWEGNKVSNPTAFAWFCWDRNHSGPTELRRISWIKG